MVVGDSQLIRMGLEKLKKGVDEELVRIENRLLMLTKRLGVDSIAELDKLFREREVDNPEIDLAWPEYIYLKNRCEELLKIREKILEKLS